MKYTESDISFAFKIVSLLIVLAFGFMHPKKFSTGDTKEPVTVIEKVKIPEEVQDINISNQYFTAKVKY
ncbi:MAG TPA: hypothetical protein VIK89_09065 [Cytophagaceae bacterium]